MAILTINGVDITNVISYAVNPQTMDSENSKRNTAAYMHREVIRRGIGDISVTCVLTGAESEAISAETDDDSFALVYFCPRGNEFKTGTFYCGQPKFEMLYYDPNDSNKNLWKVSYSFIEY